MENKAAINQEIPNEKNVAIEETERYMFLMEKSMKPFPYACGWMVHCAVCQEIMEEQGAGNIMGMTWCGM